MVVVGSSDFREDQFKSLTQSLESRNIEVVAASANYGTGTSHWAGGDFNCDATVDDDDFAARLRERASDCESDNSGANYDDVNLIHMACK